VIVDCGGPRLISLVYFHLGCGPGYDPVFSYD
jgi:hypothetical protein